MLFDFQCKHGLRSADFEVNFRSYDKNDGLELENDWEVKNIHSVLFKQTISWGSLFKKLANRSVVGSFHFFPWASCILWHFFFLCKCALITLYILLFKEEEHCSVYMLEAKPNIEILRPLYIRLIMIFAYTQVVVRTIDSTTICNVHDLGNMASNVDLFPVLTGVRVWRIIQLLIVTIVYLNRLFKQLDWRCYSWIGLSELAAWWQWGKKMLHKCPNKNYLNTERSCKCKRQGHTTFEALFWL